MKKIKIIAPFIFMILMIACTTPRSKESYLAKFGSFINEIRTEYRTYDVNDWQRADQKLEKFTEEWYEKFEEDFSLSDEFTIKQYQTQYFFYKASDGTVDFFDEYLKDDYEKLREKAEYYIENDMEDDLQDLMEKAEEAGDSAVSILNEIIEDVKEK